MSKHAIYHGRELAAGAALWHFPCLELHPGLTLVLGDEGRGKTLLLRTLAGELPQAVQQARLAGHDLHRDSAAYRQQVAWFDPTSTAWENTAVQDFWASQAQRHARWSAEVLADLALAWALTEHQHKPLYMLSAGSRRKALLAAALASGAPLTLLDRPFAALDGAASRVLREVLQDCAEHPTRAFVLADYSAPVGVKAVAVLNLD